MVDCELEISCNGSSSLENSTNGSYTEENTGQEKNLVPLDTTIGLILAFSSCFFIGISVIYKKLALKEIQERGNTRAVDGGFGYLKIPKWWFGIILMALGELTNFVAYIFAPAILVTPLGVFSIVWTAALSPYFLKESLNIVGKLGCTLVLVGCVIVTLCGPKDREIATLEELQQQLLNLGFLIYSAVVVGTSSILMMLVPRYGHKYVMLYITICSSFGSLSVMFCKGVGLAIKQTLGGINEFTNWATWVCIVCLIISLLIETIYMQKALDLFSSSVFMSVNYVMFTTMVIIASSILYTELREIGWKNIILTILGFVVNIIALYLLHLDKENVNSTPITRTRESEVTNCRDTFKQGRQCVQANESSRSSPLSNLTLKAKELRDGKPSAKFEKLSQDFSPEQRENSLSRPNNIGGLLTLPMINRVNCRSTLEDQESNPICRNRETQTPVSEVPLITKLHSSPYYEISLPTNNNYTYPLNKIDSLEEVYSGESTKELPKGDESTRLV